MKKLITILIILFAVNLTAQEVSINLYQDAGLAIKTDNYGNSPPTIDLIIKSKVHLNPIYLALNFEYVDLASGYLYRPSLGVGVMFKYKCFEVSNELNYGVLARPFKESLSYCLDTEVAVIIFKRFKLMGMIQVQERTDYDKNFTRLSGFVGIGYVINKKK